MLPAEFRAARSAPRGHPSLLISDMRVDPLRLLLQLQLAWTEGGDCDIIGADGSDEPPVDRHLVRMREKRSKRGHTCAVRVQRERVAVEWVGGGFQTYV